MTKVIDDFYIGEDGRPYSFLDKRPYKVDVSPEIEKWFKRVHAGVTGVYKGVTHSGEPLLRKIRYDVGPNAVRFKVCQKCNCGILVCMCVPRCEHKRGFDGRCV